MALARGDIATLVAVIHGAGCVGRAAWPVGRRCAPAPATTIAPAGAGAPGEAAVAPVGARGLGARARGEAAGAGGGPAAAAVRETGRRVLFAVAWVVFVALLVLAYAAMFR